MATIGLVILIVSTQLFVIGFLKGELQSARKEISEQFASVESRLADLNRSVEQIRADLHDIDRKIDNIE